MTKGERILHTRLSKGFSEEQLAEAAGVSVETIAAYEDGTIESIPCDHVEYIAKFMEVSEVYLMGWEESSRRSFDDKNIEFLADCYSKLNPINAKKLLDYANLLAVNQINDKDKDYFIY